MHHNDNLSLKQKYISKNQNGLDEINHMLVPLRNEGEQLKNVGNREINWYVTWNLVLKRHLQNENIYNKD